MGTEWDINTYQGLLWDHMAPDGRRAMQKWQRLADLSELAPKDLLYYGSEHE